MFQQLRACLWLLLVTVVLCCVAYPLVLLGIGKAIFPGQAAGSLAEHGGKTVGSRLIAQPFTDRQVFPTPALGDIALVVQRCGLRRLKLCGQQLLASRPRARQLGTIVRYASGPNKGRLVGPYYKDEKHTIIDVESIEYWFQADKFRNKPGIVGQWAALHLGVVQPWLHDWVKADKLNAAYVADWEAKHAADVDKWKSENTFDPDKPEDLAAGIAVAFFTSFSSEHPGASRASPSMRRMKRRRRPSAPLRKAATFKPCSSTCGSPITPTPTWKRCPPTW